MQSQLLPTASLLPSMQICGRHPATDACPPFPLRTVVLHDNRSTANRRLELTARHFSRDANSNWPCTATDVRFRSSQRRRARLSPPATECHHNNAVCDWLCSRNLPTTASSRVVSEPQLNAVRLESRLPGRYSCPQCQQSITMAEKAASMPDHSSYLPEMVSSIPSMYKAERSLRHRHSHMCLPTLPELQPPQGP